MKKEMKIRDEYISIESLFESMPVAMALIDRDGCHVALNEALASISGLHASQLIGTKVSEQSKESGENIKRDFKFFDEGKEVPNHEVIIGERTYYASVKPVKNKKGVVIAEMVALTDITKNKETERQLAEANKKLKFLASYDSLTEVLNSRTYYEICDKMMKISERENSDFSVLFVDLDHFKKINDTYGHDAGDIVLKEVANSMGKTIRDSDIIGRVGGEEFCIYLPNTSHNGAMNIAEKLREKIESLDFNFNNTKVKVTASIGVSSKLRHHKSIADIQRDADHAMYHAKKDGRNRVAFLNMPCYVEKYLEREVE